MTHERESVVELLLRVLAAYDDVPMAARKAEAPELASVMDEVDTFLRAQGVTSHLEVGLLRLPAQVRRTVIAEARTALAMSRPVPVRLTPDAARRIEKVSAPGSRVLRYVAARASEAQGDFEAHGGRR